MDNKDDNPAASKRRVVIESPYAGNIELNTRYARAAVRDSLERGEAPIASHLLHTQPGILREDVPEERQWGIDAGLAWHEVADAVIFYCDLGWSDGMRRAKTNALKSGDARLEVRHLAGWKDAS